MSAGTSNEQKTEKPVSPSKSSSPKKQKRKKWTAEEEKELIRVYAIAGGNNSQKYPDEDWIKLKEMLGTTRTNIQLKDKVRNLKSARRIPYDA